MGLATASGPSSVPLAALTRSRPWLPLLLVASSGLGFAVFFLLPYVVNGLAAYPLADVAGGLHDPSTLWPFDHPLWGWVFGIGAYLTLGAGPFVAIIGAGWALGCLWEEGRSATRLQRAWLGSAVLASLPALGLYFSPLGQALIPWIFD